MQALHFDAPLMMLYMEMLALLKFGNELKIKHSEKQGAERLPGLHGTFLK